MNDLIENQLQLFQNHDFVVIDNFLEQESLSRICTDALSLIDQAKPARIGSKGQFTVNSEIRSDMILWLNPEDQMSPFFLLFQKLGEIQKYLNQYFFMGVVDYESHLAFYKTGTFYAKHNDCHAEGSTRKLTYIFYLNENWKEGDGGELVMHLDEKEHKIKPIKNRLVLFLSSKIDHEVLVTNKNRTSITGWFHEKS